MAQSPELASGSGFAFEDQVGAGFLAALLSEAYAPGTGERVVSRVALQQRDFQDPLDDIIVDARGEDGSCSRLSLQCKQSLTISDARSNKDFRSIVRDCWRTKGKLDFRQGIDRYGAAVGFVTVDRARALQQLCEYARNSRSTEHFSTRFTSEGNASELVNSIKDQVATVLKEEIEQPLSEEQLQDFLAHFTLLEFDFLTEGSASKASSLNQLTAAVATPSEGPPAAWARLCLLARESGGRSGEFDRGRLVRELSPSIRLLAARSLQADIDVLSKLAHQWLADIEPEIDGVRLQRVELQAKLDAVIASAKFTQITGLPGSGKSVLLRGRVESALDRGPAIFLKYDRVEGKSWESFARQYTLSNAPLKTLLTEITAVGVPLLFIDGLDRFPKETRGVVLDLVRLILTDPELTEWRIISSLRSTSLETVSNWLGDLLRRTSIGTVEADAISDDDAQALVQQNSSLQPLLFGPARIQEIARRPFFAKILAGTGTGSADTPPRSEVDLADRWWGRGGAVEVDEGRVAVRQRTLLELAGLSVRRLGRPIALSALSDVATAIVDEFVGEAVLSRSSRGSLSFRHDIFLEWSLFQRLQDRQDDWLSELRDWGEPPAAGRVVELKSQSEYLNTDLWARTLREVRSAGMRSQWTRAWLIAPPSWPTFFEREAAYWSALAEDGAAHLRSLLVWFQAEKTTPNPTVLARDGLGSDTLRLADLLGWPSDGPAWQRLIYFLIRHKSHIPSAIRPLVLTIFDVWQNAFQTLTNPTSSALVQQSEAWLSEIEAARHAALANGIVYIPDRNPDGLRASLVALLLRSARSTSEPVERYLRTLLERDLSEQEFKEVIPWAPILAETHPSLLVDITLLHLREKLPAAHAEAERRRRDEHLEARRRVQAKDPADRTASEERFLSSPSFLHSGLPEHHDWNRLSMDRGDFFPASPLREPFASLFRQAPAEGCRLVAALANHAITAWRQLHALDPRRSGTPLPIRLDFPWGQQVFWGNAREYLWGRGVWGPPPVQCGFMALEEWAISELDAGKDLDDLLCKLVFGHECVGVLCVAAAVALQADQVSEAVLPLITAQRLLEADKERFGHDLSGSGALLIGFQAKRDAAHIASLRSSTSRPARRHQLSWLIPKFVFADVSTATRVREAISRFGTDPAFSYEEERNSDAVREALAREAAKYIELVDRKNYKLYASENPEEVLVVHDSPSAATPEAARSRSEAKRHLDISATWMWGAKCFDAGEIADGVELSAAIELARELDQPALFEETEDEADLGQRQGAVAAVAAVYVAFATDVDAEVLAWARDVLSRAGANARLPGLHSTSMTEHPWHHAIFTARGIAKEIVRGSASAEQREALLSLAGHPLDSVALAALHEVFGVGRQDPRLAWCSLRIAFRLLEMDLRSPRHQARTIHTSEHAMTVVREEIENYRGSDPLLELPKPPSPWVKTARDPSSVGLDERGRRRRNRARESGPEWGRNDLQWHWQLAAKLLPLLPVADLLAAPSRSQFLDLVAGMQSWLLETLVPPWADSTRDERHSDQPYEFTNAFGRLLGKITGELPIREASERIFKPIYALPDEACWGVLAPLVDMFVRVHVMDPPIMFAAAPAVLDACLTRILQDSTFQPGGYRQGELTGFHLPDLVKAILLVNATDAPMAARFANGNWSELSLFLFIVDRFVRSAGWSEGVISRFLTLCERAHATYPASDFADQLLAVLENPNRSEIRVRWPRTALPARIAGLIQALADRETPIDLDLSRKLLAILDNLVDMGDRRAAALQSSESFRQIRFRKQQ